MGEHAGSLFFKSLAPAPRTAYHPSGISEMPKFAESSDLPSP